MARVQHNSFVHKAKVVFCNYILGSLLYNKLTIQNKNDDHLKRTQFFCSFKYYEIDMWQCNLDTTKIILWKTEVTNK